MHRYNRCIDAILRFLAAVFDAIRKSLALDPSAALYVGTTPVQIGVLLTVSFLAGVSLLAGQSVVLFMNRVTKVRFMLSLLVNAAIYVVNTALWSTMIWLVAVVAFGVARPIGIGALAILLGSAPFVFGFLIFIPYLGLIFTRILYAWSFLSTLVVVQAAFGLGWLPALACVAVGWVLTRLLNRTIGQPITSIRDNVFHRFLGASAYIGSSSPESRGERTRRIGLRTEAALLRRKADLRSEEFEVGDKD